MSNAWIQLEADLLSAYFSVAKLTLAFFAQTPRVLEVRRGLPGFARVKKTGPLPQTCGYYVI